MLGRLEILDRETWVEVLEGGQHFQGPRRSTRDIILATERYIAWRCGVHETAKAQMQAGNGVVHLPVDAGWDDDDRYYLGRPDNGVDEMDPER
jgi:hypothetical protein